MTAGRLGAGNADAETEGGRVSHEHAPDLSMYGSEFWDERYRSAASIWSGNPNPQLIAVAENLVPGAALDVGSGEGADAIWLASRGWQVTAIDVSAVALERAARRAEESGQDIAGRIRWQQADVLTWEPPAQQFDLVSAQFMQLPSALRESLHRRLAAAVKPAGSLLIVGHHPSDLETSIHRPHHPEVLFTAEQVAATLDQDEWDTVTLAAPQRQVTDAEGRPVAISDAVLHAVRR